MILEIQNYNKEWKCPPNSLNYHYSVKHTCDALIVQFLAQQVYQWLTYALKILPSHFCSLISFLGSLWITEWLHFFQLYFATAASAESSQSMCSYVHMKSFIWTVPCVYPTYWFWCGWGKMYACLLQNSPMSNTVQHATHLLRCMHNVSGLLWRPIACCFLLNSVCDC